ncbi:MAG TPA: IPT/TIG domain-containing protein [Pyrinomonadaceae bacterium]|nr:IPT/TIG domain-containing protein [Pyrinomonadaceae bacterium]
MSAETAPRLEIGPVLKNVSAYSYRGFRPDDSDNFTGTPAPSISTSSILFELKDDPSQVDANPPGKVIFDDFEATCNTAPSPTVTTISPTSGATSGGTFVTLTGFGLPAGTNITTGGTSATSVTVASSMKGLVYISSYDRLRTAWALEGRQERPRVGHYSLNDRKMRPRLGVASTSL